MALNIEEKDGKKYIDDEEILCEYEFITLPLAIFRFSAIFIGLFVLYIFIVRVEVFSIVWIILILLVLLSFFAFIKEIKYFYHQGIFITENHLITFKGAKINKNELFIEKTTGSQFWGGTLINFYKGNYLVTQGLSRPEQKEFEIFLNTIYKISGNEDFKINSITMDNNFYSLKRNTKHKLIKKGKK